jgi:predicted nucleic acid-binding protein
MVAWIQKEPEAPLVRRFLLEADEGKLELLMSALNVGETFYILAKRRGAAVAEQFLKRLPSLPVHIVVPDQGGIMAPARIKGSHAVS